MTQLSSTGRRGGVGWSGRPTAKDVASLAGVSAQTVSRVANGADNVLPETRDRVLEVMARLGYTPNAAARVLRAGRSTSLGLVAHHISRTGEANIIEAVCATARERSYDVSLTIAPTGSADDLNRAMLRSRQGVAGLVVLGLETAEIDQLRFPSNMPVVVTDSRTLSLPTVGLDQAGGAQLAVEHLLGTGAHTVHLVAGPKNSIQSQQRQQGWRRALQTAGRPIPEPLHGDWTPASGYQAGRHLAAQDGVRAVFVANDEMASGVMRAMHEAGLRIPDDVALVGFDDVSAECLWPPLTSVRQDFRAIGEHLVTLLLERLDNPPAQGAIPVSQAIVVPPRLIVRASTARR